MTTVSYAGLRGPGFTEEFSHGGKRFCVTIVEVEGQLSIHLALWVKGGESGNGPDAYVRWDSSGSEPLPDTGGIFFTRYQRLVEGMIADFFRLREESKAVALTDQPGTPLV